MSYFWSGYKLDHFLLESLNTHSIQGLIGICIGIFSFAILFEAIGALKMALFRRFFGQNPSVFTEGNSNPIENVAATDTIDVDEGDTRNNVEIPEDSNLDPLLRNANNLTNETVNISSANRSIGHFLKLLVVSCFHGAYVFGGFTLMNAVMTFNIYVFFSVISGIGVGYFIFKSFSKLDGTVIVSSTDLTHAEPLPTSPNIILYSSIQGEAHNQENGEENHLLVTAEINNSS